MQELQEVSADMSSDLLQRLVTPGQLLPAMEGPLQELLQAADWEQAAAQGRVVPTPVSCDARHSCSAEITM